MRRGSPRNIPDYDRPGITAPQAEQLYALLEERYPGRVRRSIECMPSALNKTIDNYDDAEETIRRLLAAKAREASGAGEGSRE